MTGVQTCALPISLRLHRGLAAADARREAIALLDRVGIPDAARRVDAYPHHLSGGQRQRVMIAMALACGPDLLVADEPTTALDVTVQRQVLDLLAELVAERGMALLLVSHDLGVIARRVARTLVMYGGSIVESGPTAEVFAHRRHPYTRGLFAARPTLGGEGLERLGRLPTIPGSVPALADLPAQAPIAAEHKMQLLLVQRTDGTLPNGDTHEYDEPFEFTLREDVYQYLHEVASDILGQKIPPITRRWDGVYSQRTDGAICERRFVTNKIVIVTGPGGRGNTLAPAIAEATFKEFK